MSLDLQLQPGPCVGCGAENYPLSMGGPGRCPACDCFPPERRLKDVAAQNRRNFELVGRLARAIVEHRTATANAGPTKVQPGYEQAAEAKQRADERLWKAMES